MIFGNKIFISYFYGINPAQAETPIFPFKFQGPKRRPNQLQIYEHHFWKEQDFGAKEANKRSPEAQKRGAHAASVPSRVGPNNLALDAPLSSIFSPPPSS